VAGPGRPVPHRLRRPGNRVPARRPRVLHAAVQGPVRPARDRRAPLRAEVQRAVARRVHGHRPALAAGPRASGTARTSPPHIRTAHIRTAQFGPVQSGPARPGPARPGPARRRTARSGTAPAWAACAGPARGTAGLAVAASGRRPRHVAADQAGGHRSLGRGRNRGAGCPDFGRTGGILGYGSYRAGWC